MTKYGYFEHLGTADFLESFGFVVGFLIGTFIFSVFLGEKATTMFLLLLLASMVLLNTNRIKEFLTGRS